MIVNDCVEHDPVQSKKEQTEFNINHWLSYLTEKKT